MSCANSDGTMDCMPSERARSGSLCTSTSRPSAPAAVAGIDDDGQMAAQLHRGDHAQVECIARVIAESAHAALAEDHVVISLGENIFGGHQKFVERSGHPALQQHGLLGAAGALEQREILHVACADLD